MVADHNHTGEGVQSNARFRVTKDDLSNCEMKIVINSSLYHVMARMVEAWQTRLSRAFATFEPTDPRTDNRLAHQSPAFQERLTELQITLHHHDSDRC